MHRYAIGTGLRAVASLAGGKELAHFADEPDRWKGLAAKHRHAATAPDYWGSQRARPGTNAAASGAGSAPG